MGNSLEGRLRRLEARAEASGLTEEAQEQREWSEVLSRLCIEDLRALDDVFTAAFERGEVSGTFEELYASANECGRRALDAFKAAFEALSRDEELPSVPPEVRPWS